MNEHDRTEAGPRSLVDTAPAHGDGGARARGAGRPPGRAEGARRGPDLGPDGPTELRRTLPTPADTHELGRRLGGVVEAGDLVVLAGPLGAGKTAFAQGIGAGLGVLGRVASPTFVIARLHRPAPDGRGTALVHVDAYRLGGVGELEDLDLGLDLDHAVVVVEWGEGLAESLTDEHLLIRLDRRLDDTREAALTAAGPSWPRRLAAL